VGPPSNVAGNQGNQGPQGRQGPTGPSSNATGPQGRQGPTGPSSNASGPQGATGPTGPTLPISAQTTGTYNVLFTNNTTNAYYDSSTIGIEYYANTEELRLGGDIIAYYSSDRRLKENITPIENALDKVSRLGGYTFDWNELSHKEGTEIGVIAQEIEAEFPELVTDRENGYKAVRYDKIVAVLISAINELNEKISK
jgi:hypothetical protein